MMNNYEKEMFRRIIVVFEELMSSLDMTMASHNKLDKAYNDLRAWYEVKDEYNEAFLKALKEKLK